MTQLGLTTPAVLFSAISLRELHARFKQSHDAVLLRQIINMKRRLRLTRAMQILGISSLLFCVVTMFLIYVEWTTIAEVVFGVALIMLILSLAISIREIQISSQALDLQLGDMEEKKQSLADSLMNPRRGRL
jgi:hypothetical protein